MLKVLILPRINNKFTYKIKGTLVSVPFFMESPEPGNFRILLNIEIEIEFYNLLSIALSWALLKKATIQMAPIVAKSISDWVSQT